MIATKPPVKKCALRVLLSAKHFHFGFTDPACLIAKRITVKTIRSSVLLASCHRVSFERLQLACWERGRPRPQRARSAKNVDRGKLSRSSGARRARAPALPAESPAERLSHATASWIVPELLLR